MSLGAKKLGQGLINAVVVEMKKSAEPQKFNFSKPHEIFEE